MRAGFRSPLLLLALVAPVQAVSAGPLTPAQRARLRGTPARREPEAEEDATDARPDGPAERDALAGEGARQGAGPKTPAPALLATARRADPGPHWAPTLALATVDLARRAALAQAAEDEAALLLMLVLLEVL